MIHRAFHKSHFFTLQDLPDNLAAGEVERSLHDSRAPRERSIPFGDVGVRTMNFSQSDNFSKPSFLSEPGSTPSLEEIEREEVHLAKEKQALISDREFLPPINRSRRLKFEPLYDGGDTLEYLSDPYDSFDELMRAARRMERDKLSRNAPFKPSGSSTTQNAHEPSSLSEIVGQVHQQLAERWPHAPMRTVSDGEQNGGLIDIRADMSKCDSAESLVSSVNAFAESNPVVLEWRLTKVPERWNVVPDEGNEHTRVFSFRPPWKHPRLLTYSLSREGSCDG